MSATNAHHCANTNVGGNAFNQNMENLSFDITDSLGFFRKLKEEFRELKLNPTSTRTAINFSMNAFHLTDWLYWERMTEKEIEDIKLDYRKHKNRIETGLKDFIVEIKKVCPEMQFIHDITNGSKHAVLVRHNRQIESTEKKVGGFKATAFMKGFNVSCLLLKVDNKQLYFDEVAKIIMDFWDNYFEERAT